MRLLVTLAPLIPQPDGSIGHMTQVHDDVEGYESTPGGVLILRFKDKRVMEFNWQHLLSIAVDPFGSIARPPQGLVKL